MNKIFFYNADQKARLKNKNALKQLIVYLFQHEQVHLKRINYIFCSDQFLLKINCNFLKHDSFTDVITFSLNNKNEPVYGEVYISVERIKENAGIFNKTYQDEFIRVIIHGALHLCQYSDNTISLKRKMQNQEDFYLNMLNRLHK